MAESVYPSQHHNDGHMLSAALFSASLEGHTMSPPAAWQFDVHDAKPKAAPPSKYDVARMGTRAIETAMTARQEIMIILVRKSALSPCVFWGGTGTVL